MAKIILGLVGPIASGKGTVCQYLKEKQNAEIYRFSTMLRDVLDRFYIPQSRENMQNVSSVLRQTFGDDLMAKTIAKDVENAKSVIVAVDGVRREPDIKYLRKIPGFYLVEINADMRIRFERIIKRGENTDDNKKTFESFAADHENEAELQIKAVAAMADFHINNDGSVEDLKTQIEEILDKIRS